jgi:hypothetical protein
MPDVPGQYYGLIQGITGAKRMRKLSSDYFFLNLRTADGKGYGKKDS